MDLHALRGNDKRIRPWAERRAMSYDPKSYELAEYFLPGTASERLKDALAQAIQSRIEDWMEYEQAELRRSLGET